MARPRYTSSEVSVFCAADWPDDALDPDELTPCGACGSLDQWQSLAGSWRCDRCAPPSEAAREVRAAIERIRERDAESTGLCGQHR